MRRWQSIQAARAGLHVTPFGKEFEVTHEMQRSYCIEVRADSAPKWEAESGRGFGWYIEVEDDNGVFHKYERPALSTPQRQAIAMAQFAPRKEDE